jgi:uncharacterized UBP type Zn finger protein
MSDSACTHLDAAAHRAHGVHPSGHGCAECLATGGTWVHLRLCLTCGHVGCCDNSPGRHATAHYHATRHPVIRSYEPGEPWAYCYPHDAFAEELRAQAGESAPVHYDPPRR